MLVPLAKAGVRVSPEGLGFPLSRERSVRTGFQRSASSFGWGSDEPEEPTRA
jgi:hypothetical protein